MHGKEWEHEMCMHGYGYFFDSTWCINISAACQHPTTVYKPPMKIQLIQWSHEGLTIHLTNVKVNTPVNIEAQTKKENKNG